MTVSFHLTSAGATLVVATAAGTVSLCVLAEDKHLVPLEINPEMIPVTSLTKVVGVTILREKGIEPPVVAVGLMVPLGEKGENRSSTTPETTTRTANTPKSSSTDKWTSDYLTPFVRAMPTRRPPLSLPPSTSTVSSSSASSSSPSAGRPRVVLLGLPQNAPCRTLACWDGPMGSTLHSLAWEGTADSRRLAVGCSDQISSECIVTLLEAQAESTVFFSYPWALHERGRWKWPWEGLALPVSEPAVGSLSAGLVHQQSWMTVSTGEKPPSRVFEHRAGCVVAWLGDGVLVAAGCVEDRLVPYASSLVRLDNLPPRHTFSDASETASHPSISLSTANPSGIYAGRCRAIPTGPVHPRPVFALGSTRDGRLVTASFDHSIAIWSRVEETSPACRPCRVGHGLAGHARALASGSGVLAMAVVEGKHGAVRVRVVGQLGDAHRHHHEHMVLGDNDDSEVHLYDMGTKSQTPREVNFASLASCVDIYHHYLAVGGCKRGDPTSPGTPTVIVLAYDAFQNTLRPVVRRCFPRERPGGGSSASGTAEVTSAVVTVAVASMFGAADKDGDGDGDVIILARTSDGQIYVGTTTTDDNMWPLLAGMDSKDRSAFLPQRRVDRAPSLGPMAVTEIEQKDETRRGHSTTIIYPLLAVGMPGVKGRFHLVLLLPAAQAKATTDTITDPPTTTSASVSHLATQALTSSVVPQKTPPAPFRCIITLRGHAWRTDAPVTHLAWSPPVTSGWARDVSALVLGSPKGDVSFLEVPYGFFHGASWISTSSPSTPAPSFLMRFQRNSSVVDLAVTASAREDEWIVAVALEGRRQVSLLIVGPTRSGHDHDNREGDGDPYMGEGRKTWVIIARAQITTHTAPVLSLTWQRPTKNIGERSSVLLSGSMDHSIQSTNVLGGDVTWTPSNTLGDEATGSDMAMNIEEGVGVDGKRMGTVTTASNANAPASTSTSTPQTSHFASLVMPLESKSSVPVTAMSASTSASSRLHGNKGRSTSVAPPSPSVVFREPQLATSTTSTRSNTLLYGGQSVVESSPTMSDGVSSTDEDLQTLERVLKDQAQRSWSLDPYKNTNKVSDWKAQCRLLAFAEPEAAVDFLRRMDDQPAVDLHRMDHPGRKSEPSSYSSSHRRAGTTHATGRAIRACFVHDWSRLAELVDVLRDGPGTPRPIGHVPRPPPKAPWLALDLAARLALAGGAGGASRRQTRMAHKFVLDAQARGDPHSAAVLWLALGRPRAAVEVYQRHALWLDAALVASVWSEGARSGPVDNIRACIHWEVAKWYRWREERGRARAHEMLAVACAEPR